MSLDLTVRSAAGNVVVGTVDDDELPVVCSLLDRRDDFFLRRLTDLYEDHVFGVETLVHARAQLHELLPQDLEDSERRVLHKLISVVSYAISVGQPLRCIAD